MTRAYERFESLLFTVSMPYVLADNYCRKVATGNSTFSRYNHFSIGTSACVFIGSTFILYKSYTAPSEKGPLKLGKKRKRGRTEMVRDVWDRRSVQFQIYPRTFLFSSMPRSSKDKWGEGGNEHSTTAWEQIIFGKRAATRKHWKRKHDVARDFLRRLFAVVLDRLENSLIPSHALLATSQN